LENGYLFSTNTILGNENNLSEEQFSIDDKKSYKLKIMENEIFLFENGSIVYHFNKTTGIFEKLIDSSESMQYTPFYDRILFCNGNELWIFLVKDVQSPFFKTAGSLIHITRFSQKVEDLKWLNADYFTYSLDGKIWISEIDNRDTLNAFAISGIGGSKVFFNGNTKKLFVLNGDSLIESKNKIIP
jgi:hypothetical protein